MSKKNRELEIRLSEYQADIQICLTSSFGVLAVIIAVMVWFEQLYFSPSTSTSSKDVLNTWISLLGVIGIAVFIVLMIVMVARRLQIGKLKEDITDEQTQLLKEISEETRIIKECLLDLLKRTKHQDNN
jgi:Trk-type K+ transport system membrane component